ncbi:ABC transporter ATP-binding protein [Solidesulfovibrio sp.]
MTLCACDIAFSYAGRDVLRGAGLTIAKGRVAAVLGVNGAGKSTLLRCLGGLLRPHQGTVTLGGCDLATMGRREAARRIAYVPQSQRPGLLTVFEAVLLGRRPHMGLGPSRRDTAAVETVLHSLDLSRLAFCRLDELSGGELQKTAIARALVQEPTVLLLDEPTASLDLKNTMEVFGIIRRAVRTGDVAAVAVLHDLSQAMRFADDFILLRNGRIHAVLDRAGLTPEAVRAVYGVEVAFGEVGGHPVAMPLKVADAA